MFPSPGKKKINYNRCKIIIKMKTYIFIYLKFMFKLTKKFYQVMSNKQR